MERLIVLLFFAFSIIIANPLLTDVINEFQTDTILGQRFEFHPIQYGSEIPLFNTRVSTPGGVAYVDTAITNPPYGYTAIENSMLNGPFYLPLTTGYIDIYLQDYFLDDIDYADTINSPVLAPTMGTSASRFIFFVGTTPHIDWYIDSTPTFGSENDDYPGCVISGTVYLNSVPIENAKVTATVIDSIQTPGPFYKTCTTYTNNNGFYQFDSLWPLRYWMTASFGNHSPQGELSPQLCALWNKNLNFYFVGIEENLTNSQNQRLWVYPNPFQNHCVIKFQMPSTKFQNLSTRYSLLPALKIYDVSGRLVKSFPLPTCYSLLSASVSWSGDDDSGRKLPAGVYFIRLEVGDFKQVEKVILLQ